MKMTKPYIVIIIDHPLFGTHERWARTAEQARQIARLALAAGAERAKACGPRGWL